MKKNMSLKEVNDYLGITDNIDYMGRAKIITDFRLLEKLINNIDGAEIILKDDYKIQKLYKENKIIYEYNYCIKEECVLKSSDIIGGYKKLILKLNIENNLENIDTYTLGENFIKVKYTINGQEYTSSLKNKTPTSSKSTLYLEVEEKIKEANKRKGNWHYGSKSV